MTMNEDFKKDLESLLNRHCVDNELHTPDFILADHLVRALDALRHTSEWRERWFGHGLRIGGPVPLTDVPDGALKEG
jgi:hypothetical protein